MEESPSPSATATNFWRAQVRVNMGGEGEGGLLIVAVRFLSSSVDAMAKAAKGACLEMVPSYKQLLWCAPGRGRATARAA
jgi:hypothetical protein